MHILHLSLFKGRKQRGHENGDIEKDKPGRSSFSSYCSSIPILSNLSKPTNPSSFFLSNKFLCFCICFCTGYYCCHYFTSTSFSSLSSSLSLIFPCSSLLFFLIHDHCRACPAFNFFSRRDRIFGYLVL